MNNNKASYTKRVKQFTVLLKKNEKFFNKISVARAAIIGSLVLFYYLAKIYLSLNFAYAISLFFIVIFFWALSVHNKIEEKIKRVKILVKINEEGLNRLEDNWSEFPVTGEEFLDRSKPHLSDLNIFGKNSLFQMIQFASTRWGREELAKWLTECHDFSEIENRQKGVMELSHSISFRQHLLLEGRMVCSTLDPEKFIEWTKSPSFLTDKKWILFLRKFLVTTTFISLLLNLAEIIPPFWIGSLFLQFLIFVLTVSKCRAYYLPALNKESIFLAYAKMFKIVEQKKMHSSLLCDLQRVLRNNKTSISQQMEQLEKINHNLSLCFSSLYPFINILLLWDIHFLYKLEIWKENMASHISPSFNALAIMEAISSLAGFAYDNPQYKYPEITNESLPLSTKNIGHPLIPAKERVSNDFEIRQIGKLAIVTGSNMSGKSTFIRTVGINVILAFAGAPVAAETLSLRPCRIMTCIQVEDSLKLHTSHFYAEVKGIKNILDSVFIQKNNESPLPVLYIIDEIFSGTNTKERLYASKGIILKLAGANCYGILTTHDLDLVELEKESSYIENYHFTDNVSNEGEMVFDYKIKSGPVTSTNALKVLEMAGIKI
jgi:hypothetical protein